MPITAGAALRDAAARLAAAGIDNPALDARLLLAFATGLDQAALISSRASLIEAGGFGALVARRAAREPLAFIIGRQGFWSLDLDVSDATLIPRPDSETLIDAAMAAFPERGQVLRVLDLGTGTGCLLLAALSEFPAAWGLGVDCSWNAIALARRNAARLEFDARASFAVGDWAGAVEGRFDLVLSNPPYIPADEVSRLMPEVSRFEPRGALDGGPDGLDCYRALLGGLRRVAAPDGVAIVEVGAGQAEAVAGLARSAGFTPTFRNDLGGVARAVVLHGGVGSRVAGD